MIWCYISTKCLSTFWKKYSESFDKESYTAVVAIFLPTVLSKCRGYNGPFDLHLDPVLNDHTVNFSKSHRGVSKPTLCHWRIQGACPAHAPLRFQILSFRHTKFQNVAASGVHAPPTRSTPLYGKSWIRHCLCHEEPPMLVNIFRCLFEALVQTWFIPVFIIAISRCLD